MTDTKQRRTRTLKPKPSPTELRELLYDTSIHAVSVAQAAQILGIARSTASHAIRKTGVLVEGVPIMRAGRRQLISTTHLRDVLGIPQPLRLFDVS